jgi:hypothetical protein
MRGIAGISVRPARYLSQTVSAALLHCRRVIGRSVFAGLWAGLTLASALSGAPIPGPATSNSFGLYLPAEALPAPVLLHGTNDLSRIRLAATPVISDADIVSYDLAQHLMRLRPDAIERISRLLTKRPNSAFVAVADGAPVYLGVFARFDSLELFGVPTIITDWRYEEQPADTFAITWPFPPGLVPGTGRDPRVNERIKFVLNGLNKLQQLGDSYSGVVARRVTVTNAIPSRMAHYLSAQFMESDSGGNTNRTGAAAGSGVGSRQPGLVLLVEDPRTGSVIVSGPPERVFAMSKVILELDARPYHAPGVWPDGTLGPDEAKALAHQLANAKARAIYGVEPFRGGPTPTWVGRWVWGNAQFITEGEIQAMVSFEANGSNQVVTVTLPKNREPGRKPSAGF